MRCLVLLVLFCIARGNAQEICIYGKITDSKNGQALAGTSILLLNSTYGTVSLSNGYYHLKCPYKKHISILFKSIGYEKKLKELDPADGSDSIMINISLNPQPIQFDTLTIYAKPKPDTLLGAPDYSIYDFDFHEDKFILLTARKSLQNADLRLSDIHGKVITTYPVPKEGGEAKELYHDYMGFTNLICKNYIYRINMYHDRFVLIPLAPEDVNAFIKPILDTINGQIIFTDYWKDYPMFSYYSFTEKDSTKQQLITIEDKALMDSYNFEYYSLKPREKLEARRLAMAYNTDKRIVASLMSGFTKSMFYEPLYAPLFIIKDTICVFDHYKDMLFHFNKNGQKVDSFAISYNHPKNWKEWKRLMLKDELENRIYAVYDKNGHKYIKQISTQNGKDLGKYSLQFHNADRLKIRDGYAYYIYRPFESTQEKYFYRELIKLEKTP